MTKLVLAAALAATLVTPLAAQTGYGAPSARQYRDEQARTRALNREDAEPTAPMAAPEAEERWSEPAPDSADGRLEGNDRGWNDDAGAPADQGWDGGASSGEAGSGGFVDRGPGDGAYREDIARERYEMAEDRYRRSLERTRRAEQRWREAQRDYERDRADWQRRDRDCRAGIREACNEAY